MAEVSATVDVSAVDRLLDRLDQLTNPVDSAPMREGLHNAIAVYRTAMGARFRAASGGDGTWKPLAPSTIRRRIASGESPPLQILRITGSLYRSVADPNSPFATEVFGSDGVQAGAADPKARWQHSGTGRIPSRPIIAPPDQQTTGEMASAIATSLKKAVREAGK